MLLYGIQSECRCRIVGVDIYVDTFYVDCRYFSLLIIHIPIVYDRSQKPQQQFQIMTQR